MKKVIVVAHSDDEILFFSSILERVDTSIATTYFKEEP